MMSPSTRSILDVMCQQAVDDIVSGRYEESILVLTKALTGIQQELASKSASAPATAITIEGQQPYSTAFKGLLQIPQYYRVDMQDESSPSQIHSFDNPSEPRIFAAPLVVPSSPSPTAATTAFLYQQAPCSSEQYQFIVTYNLALSHHLCAMQQRDDRKLRVALGLWDLIYRFHWNDNLGLVTFHTCAILNNYGHGLRYMGAEKPARECFESLLCALCVCVQKNSSSHSPSLLDVCKTDCFFHSVTTLILKDPMTASAA